MSLSPMMRQYNEIKEEYKDCVLFYRIGDFYEMFWDDAKLASRVLELTLTGKQCGLKERAPMCGVPFHAADSYIAKLVEQGYKVAVCEQLEDPAEAKGMVKRGVIKIVTPGTITASTVLRENENNYIACVFLDGDDMSVSYSDISTGELCTTEQTDVHAAEYALDELVKIDPSEIIANAEFIEECGRENIAASTGAFVRSMDDSYFAERTAVQSIRSQFGQISLTALGIDGRAGCVRSVGALLGYLIETQKSNLGQIVTCRFYERTSSMSLDRSTIRNLELTETLFDKREKGSLLGVLDKTKTAMGARMLKKWIKEPLNDADSINERLDTVEALQNDHMTLRDLQESLAEIYDFERLGGRIASGNANGRDLIALKKSADALPGIEALLAKMDTDLIRKILAQMPDISDVSEIIGEAVNDDPPITVKDGGIIKSGYSENLDSYRLSIKDSKAWIAGLEQKEKDRTGITHLKVGYNKVFGYYIEVSRSNLDLVPDDYIRKQTLVGGERFVTPKLKETEDIVLNGEARINKLEYELFTDVRERCQKKLPEIQSISRAVAVLDVLCTFADVSTRNGYVKPTVDDSHELEIAQGRHPVIEQTTGSGLFVANDTYMNDSDQSMLLITGPNMAGKSTYMRQTAMIVLMAQIGCFVPASRAKIGVVDRIFTRIGASDNLSRGESTFFVEMSELAYILRNATNRSLVILDEIGRGTSTYDGLSIAWATVEYLCSAEKHVRTLFATHYHELTALEDELRGVVNLNVDVSDNNGSIIFLHKIVPGPASRSYGIHVARLAGVPEALLGNAEDKLQALESGEAGGLLEKSRGGDDLLADEYDSAKPDSVGGSAVNDDSHGYEEQQQFTFVMQEENPVVDMLRSVDIMNTTPAQAIKLLEDLKKLAEE
ncbi:MAG: DNA mismatch repair protein MutS [Eubacteriales bacterium]|nr:DNA mismatch repair protein MutS [Eubacteriales bacterium]